MPLPIERRFSDADSSPYDQFEPWSRRTVAIKDVDGKPIFSQEVHAPESWSDQSVRVVAQKYFYGDKDKGFDPGAGGREDSVWKLADRVACAIGEWSHKDGYTNASTIDVFRDELIAIILGQRGAFNSPVWFNAGIASYGIKGSPGGFRLENGRAVPNLESYTHPQLHACFIQSVDDNMASIMALATSEAMLFKFGSGTGSDLSTLRSSREKLSGGGKPSGPVSFMRIYDAVASVIKSGGRTRRSAKMQTLKCWHPDVWDFVNCKAHEDLKARALVAAGFSGGMDGDAGTVLYQNANLSVRVTDEFMEKSTLSGDAALYDLRAVTTGAAIDRTSAADLLTRIAENTHQCGDPGLQYEDTINRWHMIPSCGPINSSNPCSEYLSIDDSACNLASLNLMRFRRPDGTFDVDSFVAACRLFIFAQDSLIDHASYPTPKIAENAHKHRELGLGYCGLGAYLMVSGLPYDSDEGRSLAGAITAIMHGAANLASSEAAKHLGTFVDYEANRENVDRIMRDHENLVAMGQLQSGENGESREIQRLWREARYLWAQTVAHVAAHGLRNSQVTVLAPTGCAVPQTLVLTDRGLARLGSLGNPDGDRWQDVSFRVQTHQGPKDATKFFINGQSHVIELRTKGGYQFDATPKHRIKVVGVDGEWKWSRMGELSWGEYLPVKIGGMIGSPIPVTLHPFDGPMRHRTNDVSFPSEMNGDLAQLIGSFQANGSSHAKGLRISVYSGDSDLIAATERLFLQCFGIISLVVPDEDQESVSVYANSVPLVRWWEDNGFSKIRPDGHVGKGMNSRIPSSILATNDPLIYAAFLRGYSDHDGTVAEGCPEVMNKDRDFVADLKTMLMAIGIPTGLRYTISGKTGKPLWRARVLNRSYCNRWNELIGYTAARKQEAVICADSGKNDLIPIPRRILDDICPVHHDSRKAVAISVGRSRAISRRIADQLYRESGHPELGQLLGFFYDRIESAALSLDMRPTYDISVPENVTYVANGFVSHNTIAFMMGSDHSTGVEPSLGLVLYKALAGGGALKIVNPDVPESLARLGYSEGEISLIAQHIDRFDTIEDVPAHSSRLKPEHLPVFDCAFPPAQGGRSIAPMGHVKMVGSCQRFISGAISKTINLPESATVADIRDVYVAGWKLGCKAIAVFRDGSKATQVVSTGPAAASPVASPVALPAGPVRERLPDTRASITHKGYIDGEEFFVTLGFYPDGRIGEIFPGMSKEGSTLGGMMDAWGTAMSLLLQYGVPLDVLITKFTAGRFPPSGMTRNSQIPIASSVVDYIMRLMALGYRPGPILVPGDPSPDSPVSISSAPVPILEANVSPGRYRKLCLKCGNFMIPLGPSCFECPGCFDKIGGCG